jgi:hypothetical protein
MMHDQSCSCVRTTTSTQDLRSQDLGGASASSDVLSKEDVRSIAVQETWAGEVLEAVLRTWTRIREYKYRHDLSLDEEEHSVLTEQLSITSEIQRLEKAEQSLHRQLQQADYMLVNRLREDVDVKAAVIRLMDEDLQKASELCTGEDATLMSQQFSIQSEMQRLRDLEKDLHLQLEQAHLEGEVQDVSPTRWRVNGGWSSGVSIRSDSDGSDDATCFSASTRSENSILSDRTWDLTRLGDAGFPTAAVCIPLLVDDNLSKRVSVPLDSVKKGIFSSPIKCSSPVTSLYQESSETMDETMETSCTTSSDLDLQLEQAHLGLEVQDVSPTRWREDAGLSSGVSIRSDSVGSDDATSFSPSTRSDNSILSDRTWDLTPLGGAGFPTAAVRIPWLVDDALWNRVSVPPDSMKKGIFSSPNKCSSPVTSRYLESSETIDNSSTTSSFSSIPFHLPTKDTHVLIDAPIYSLDPISVDLGDSLSAPTVCSDIESEFEKCMRIREFLRENEEDVSMFSQQEVSVGSERQRLGDLDKSSLSSHFQETDYDGESQHISTNIRDGRPSPQCLGGSVHSSDYEHSLSIDCEPEGAIFCTPESSYLEIWRTSQRGSSRCANQYNETHPPVQEKTERTMLRQDENTRPFSFSMARPRAFGDYHGVSPAMEPTADIENGILSPSIICSSSSPSPSMYHESPETMDTTSLTLTEHSGVPSPTHSRFSNRKMPLKTARFAPHEDFGDDDAFVDDDSLSALSTGCSIVESSKGGSLLNRVANVLFGDTESLVPTFSSLDRRLFYHYNFAKRDERQGVSPTVEPTADIDKGISSPILICSSSHPVPSMYHERPETMNTTNVTFTEHTGVLPSSPTHSRFSNHKMPLKTARLAPHEAFGDDDVSVDDDSLSALSTGCSIVESSKGGSLLNTVANVLFGDAESLVPNFSSLDRRLFNRYNFAERDERQGVSPTMEPTADIEKGISSPIPIYSSSRSVPSIYHEPPEAMDTTSVTFTEHTAALPSSPIHFRCSNHKMPLKTAGMGPHEGLNDDDASVDDDSLSVLTTGTGCFVEESSKGGSLLNTVADVLFGEKKYLVRTFCSHRKLLYCRSYQGGASFGMATALLCIQLHIHFAFLLPLPAVAILPVVAVWVEVHTAHDVDEAKLGVIATILSLSIKLFTAYYSSSSSSTIREIVYTLIASI